MTVAAAVERSCAANARASARALAGVRGDVDRARGVARALQPGGFLSCLLRVSRRFFRIYRALPSCHRAPPSPRHF